MTVRIGRCPSRLGRGAPGCACGRGLAPWIDLPARQFGTPPFRCSGSLANFYLFQQLPLFVWHLLCAGWLGERTSPPRPVCNVDGPELLRLPGYEARGFLLIPVPTVGPKHKPSCAAGRPGSSRETTMTSSARLAAAVICMSAVVACSRTERTVIQPAPAPATVVTPAPAGSVVTTQPASTTVYTTR